MTHSGSVSNRNPRHPFEPTQTAGDVDHLGLGELSTFPGGSELFWILDRRSGVVSGLELDMSCKVYVDVLWFSSLLPAIRFWVRLQCAPTVDITGEAHRFWMGVLGLLWCGTMVEIRSQAFAEFSAAMSEAENVGMRNDVKISYQLFVFPFRELVSDFVRARKVPYCNVTPACSFTCLILVTNFSA